MKIGVHGTFAVHVPKTSQGLVSCIRIPLYLEFPCLICLEDADEHDVLAPAPLGTPEEATAVQVSDFVFVFC